MKKVICTICSNNYISYIRILAKSYLKYNSDGNVIVLLADEKTDEIDWNKEPFTEVITARELGIPNFDEFAFKYNVTEFNTAVKPFFIEYIYKKYKLKNLLFFDPDIRFFHPIDNIFRLLNRYNFILIPHITQPYPHDGKLPNENSILVAGAYNLGFIGLGKWSEISEFISWWQRHLYDHCLIDTANGLFTDQKWIDLLPSLRNDVYFLKEPQYNVAYWNLHERTIGFKSGRYYCNNKPLAFFHFSGIKPFEKNQISTHQTRYKLTGGLKRLFDLYRKELFENGYSETRQLKYEFGYFKNGINIQDSARKFFYRLSENDKKEIKNPFLYDRIELWKATADKKEEKEKQSAFSYACNIYSEALQNKMPNILMDDYILAKARRKASGIKILSLGSGSAEWEISIAGRRPDRITLHLADIDQNSLLKAKKSCFGISIETFSIDVNKITLKENAYDIVVFRNSIHHFHNIGHILTQIKKALCEHGEVMVIGGKLGGINQETYNSAQHIFSLLPDRFRRNFYTKKADLELPKESRQGINIYPLLLEHFKERESVMFDAFISVFFDFRYGGNYDTSLEFDRKIIEFVTALDAHYIENGMANPTCLYGIFENR